MAQYITHTVLSYTLGRGGLRALKTTVKQMDASILNFWKQFTLTGMAPQTCGDMGTVFSMPLQEDYL